MSFRIRIQASLVGGGTVRGTEAIVQFKRRAAQPGRNLRSRVPSLNARARIVLRSSAPSSGSTKNISAMKAKSFAESARFASEMDDDEIAATAKHEGHRPSASLQAPDSISAAKRRRIAGRRNLRESLRFLNLPFRRIGHEKADLEESEPACGRRNKTSRKSYSRKRHFAK